MTDNGTDADDEKYTDQDPSSDTDAVPGGGIETEQDTPDDPGDAIGAPIDDKPAHDEDRRPAEEHPGKDLQEQAPDDEDDDDERPPRYQQ